jgi:hypothetical protein
MMGLFWGTYMRGHTGDQEGVDWPIEAHTIAKQLGDQEMILATRMNMPTQATSYEQEIQEQEEKVRIARQSGRDWWVANGLAHLGQSLRTHGDRERADTVLSESVALYRQEGDAAYVASSLLELGILEFQRGDYVRATQRMEEGLVIARQAGVSIIVADLLVELATVALHQCSEERVGTAIKEAIGIYQQAGNAIRVAQCLCVVAGLLQAQGQPELAICLLAATGQQHSELPRVLFTFPEEYDMRLAALRAELALADFDMAWSKGCAMTLDQAVEYVLSNVLLG